jgi:methyltransferase-like protein
MVNDLVFVKHTDAVYRIIDSQAIILTPENGHMHTLNEVGTFIWELLDGKKTLKAIMDRLCEEFDIEAAKAQRDVTHFAEDLVRRKLISAKTK